MARSIAQKTYVLVGIIFVLLIVVHLLGWLSPLERLIRSLFLPFIGQARTFSIQVGDDYQFFKNENDFIKAYQTAETKNLLIEVQTAKIKLLEDENKHFQELLNFQKKNKYTLIIADVIGHDSESSDQIVTLNQGSNDGAAIGQTIVVDEGILVGKIIKVTPDTSSARLINDNQSRIGATVLNQDHSLGVVEGGFGISLEMNLIPRDEVVQVGDQIITSGLEAGVVRGLIIGTVQSVENEAYKPFQKAILTSAIDLGKLTTVAIIKQ
jgi:rod shape-determining protein MreC